MGDILKFKKDAGQTTLTIVEPFKYSETACQHNALKLVDDMTKRVECSKCKVILDPFEVLLQMAEGQRKLNRDIARLKALKAEVNAIMDGWTLTQKERKRIGDAGQAAALEFGHKVRS